jgi:hypothetical protein
MEYEEVGGNLGPSWPTTETKVGSVVTGTLKEIQEGQYGDNYVLGDVTLNGEKLDSDLLVWGATILRSRMSKVSGGSKVKIEFLGEVKTGTGRQAKNFKVSVAK